MSLFKREWSSSVTKAEFNVRPPERRARTSWLVPPLASAPIEPDEAAALLPPSVPEAVEAAPIVRPRSERPPEMRQEARSGSDEPTVALSHPPPTIHAAFIVNHGQARVTELIERLASSIEILAGERVRVLGQAESQLIELAVAIARRVIGRELADDPTLLADLASEGIEALGAKERLVVRVGDIDDDAGIDAIRARLTARAPQCQVVHDPTLPRGGCIVETEYGTVDESLEARLASVVDAITATSKEAPQTEAPKT
jgi:flagellar assembly protein FliH